MKTFIVRGTNRPGELANLTGELATKQVNVQICVLGYQDWAIAGFVASDETAAETAVKAAGFEYEIIPSIAVRLVNQPGQVAAIGQKLGDQGVNIQCFIPLESTDTTGIVAIAVDNIEAATKALGDQIVEYTFQ